MAETKSSSLLENGRNSGFARSLQSVQGTNMRSVSAALSLSAADRELENSDTICLRKQRLGNNPGSVRDNKPVAAFMSGRFAPQLLSPTNGFSRLLALAGHRSVDE